MSRSVMVMSLFAILTLNLDGPPGGIAALPSQRPRSAASKSGGAPRNGGWWLSV